MKIAPIVSWSGVLAGTTVTLEKGKAIEVSDAAGASAIASAFAVKATETAKSNSK